MNWEKIKYDAKHGVRLSWGVVKAVLFYLPTLCFILFLIWLTMMQAIFIWVLRSFRYRQNLLPELKKRALKDGKLW